MPGQQVALSSRDGVAGPAISAGSGASPPPPCPNGTVGEVNRGGTTHSRVPAHAPTPIPVQRPNPACGKASTGPNAHAGRVEFTSRPIGADKAGTFAPRPVDTLLPGPRANRRRD